MLPILPATHAQLVFPPLHPALDPYRPLIEASVKPAWRLRCHQVESLSRTATHVGGFTPYMPVDRGWPRCPACGEALSFIWQLNFADFEAATFAPAGLFQFFYCWVCFPLPGYTLYPFEKLCRWYPDFSGKEAEAVPQALCPYLDELSPDQQQLNRPYRGEIIPFLSVPSASSEEHPVSQDMQSIPLTPSGETFYEVYNQTSGLSLGDCLSQIGGYPDWVQSTDETPHCPVCGGRAELVGAIGSADTNFIWGDTGYWYLFACQRTDRCRGLHSPLMASQSL